MRVACLMMQKNESSLLEPWILYHATLFGFENLYIYDNGSTEIKAISALKKYASLGVNVQWEMKSKADFESKGLIFSNLIKAMDESRNYDFYFPLDADEFLAVDDGSEVKIDATSIFESLRPYLNSKSPLMISSALDNNPLYPEYFFKSIGQRKTFFANGACESLDLGFHEGESKYGEAPVKTPVVYFHHHYKTYNSYVKSARQKLEGRVQDFERQTLLDLKEEEGPGFHLVGKILDGPDEYYRELYRNFQNRRERYVAQPAYCSYVSALGVELGGDGVSQVQIAFERNFKRASGYVDLVGLSGSKMRLRGWYYSLYEEKMEDAFVELDGRTYPIEIIRRFNRPDVSKQFLVDQDDIGYEAIVDLERQDFNADFSSLRVYLRGLYYVTEFHIGSGALVGLN